MLWGREGCLSGETPVPRRRAWPGKVEPSPDVSQRLKEITFGFHGCDFSSSELLVTLTPVPAATMIPQSCLAPFLALLHTSPPLPGNLIYSLDFNYLF